MSRALLGDANLSSVRWAKSSQGSRRGTCGWITSFFIFYFDTIEANLHSRVDAAQAAFAHSVFIQFILTGRRAGS